MTLSYEDSYSLLRECHFKKQHDNEDIEYCVVDDVLVIPGTNELEDWLKYNLDVRLIRRTGVGWVHHGFHRASFKPSWSKNIKHVIGHSLGGAIAVLIAHRFNLDCCTFGTPNIGFTKRLPGIHYRNRKDPIRYTPYGFNGKIVYLGEQGLPSIKDHSFPEYNH